MTMSVVAITGGARGIGRATAAAFLRAGHSVAIGDVDHDAATRAAHDLGCLGLRLDVTDESSFRDFLDRVEAELGDVDVLVNNAGIMLLSTVDAEPAATARRMLDVNIGGVVTGSRLALERMRPRNRGHIVNLASTLGKTALPGAATYCATKFAVVGFTESLRAELRTTPLQVSLVMPGLVDTELGSGVRSSLGVRIARPEDVAAAVVDAVGRKRYAVYVPARAGAIVTLLAAMPTAVRERGFAAVRADRIFLDVDQEERRGYLEREST